MIVGSAVAGRVYAFDGNADGLLFTLELPSTAICDRGHIEVFLARRGFGHAVAAGIDDAGDFILVVGAYAEVQRLLT